MPSCPYSSFIYEIVPWNDGSGERGQAFDSGVLVSPLEKFPCVIKLKMSHQCWMAVCVCV